MQHLDQPLWCETKIAEITSEQAIQGVTFDKRKASFLVHKLSEDILAIDREAVPQLPKMLNTADEYKKPFLKSGKLAHWPKLYCMHHGIPEDWVGGPFSRVWYTDFDTSKLDRVKRVLIEHGWIPTDWNTKKLIGLENVNEWVDNYVQKNFIEEKSSALISIRLKQLKYRGARNRRAISDFLKGQRFVITSPKITEESLGTVTGSVGRLMMERVVLSHRRSLLQGLIKQVREDGRLGAACNPCATPTFRANYKVVVNIPAARSTYGRELRSLFTGDSDVASKSVLHTFKEKEGYRVLPHTNIIQRVNDQGEWKSCGRSKLYLPNSHVMLGSDAAGLEARMLCHYMNDPEYTDILLNGDIHSYNQMLAGLPTRDHAKVFFYAFLYGAGDANLGAQVGGGKAAGAEMRANFLSGLPKLNNLIERLQREANSGKIVGLDGRTLHMRRGWDGLPETHKALNTLLQSAGAILFKYSMIILDHWVKEAGLDAHQVMWQHDETSWSCHKKDVQQLKLFMDNNVRVAGEFLNLNLPMASDTQVGSNWYDVH